MKRVRWTAVLVALLAFPILALAFGGLEGLKECSDADLEEVQGKIHPDDSPQMAVSGRTREESTTAVKDYAKDVPMCVQPQLAAQYAASCAGGGWDAFANLLNDAGGQQLTGQAEAAVNPFAMVGDFLNDATGGMAGVSVDLSGLNTTVTRSGGGFTNWGGLTSGGVESLAKILPTFHTQSEGIVNLSAAPTIGNRVTGEYVGDFKGSLGVSISASVSMKP